MSADTVLWVSVRAPSGFSSGQPSAAKPAPAPSTLSLGDNFSTLPLGFSTVAFSVAVRGAQHLEAMENPQSHGDNAFAKHTSNYHKGEEEEVQYGLELVGHFTKPVERLVCEGVYIHSDPSDLVMNDKLDHHLPAVARVTYSNSAADRGEGGSRGRGRGGGRGGGRGRRGSLRTTRPG